MRASNARFGLEKMKLIAGRFTRARPQVLSVRIFKSAFHNQEVWIKQQISGRPLSTASHEMGLSGAAVRKKKRVSKDQRTFGDKSGPIMGVDTFCGLDIYRRLIIFKNLRWNMYTVASILGS